MHHAAAHRPEITPHYRAEAEREIRAFTRAWTARDDRLALLSYGATFAAYFFTLWLAVQAWPVWWLVVPLIVVNALAGVRLYVLQHDCGHGSFFKRRWANDMVGRVIGVLTLTPYDDWRRSHAKHHAGSGNLDRRGVGDIDLLTVAEYQALPFRRRLAYRLSRNAIVLLVIAPIYVFILRQRLPNDLFGADRRARGEALPGKQRLAPCVGDAARGTAGFALLRQHDGHFRRDVGRIDHRFADHA